MKAKPSISTFQKSLYQQLSENINETTKILRDANQILEKLIVYHDQIQFESNENESDEEIIKKIETILSTIQTILLQKNDFFIKTSKLSSLFSKIKSSMKEIKNINQTEIETFEIYSSNLVNIMMEKEEEIYQRDILLLEEQTKKRKMKYLQRKDELTKQISQCNNYHNQFSSQNQYLSYSHSPTITIHSSREHKSSNRNSRNIDSIVETLEIIDMREMIDLKNSEIVIDDFENDEDNNSHESFDRQMDLFENEIIREENIRQLEEWTQMKFGDILFDSKHDSWNRGNSSFAQKIIGKSNVVFIIKDEKLNEFGCYIHTQINITDSKISDANAFVFSLYSNNRIKHPTKFEIKNQSGDIFCLYSDENPSWLFGIGNSYLFDIGLSKKGVNADHCLQSSFDYLGYSNALIGEKKFIPKRIVCIQMMK